MKTGEIITLAVTGIVSLALVSSFERRLLKNKRRPWFTQPVKSLALRLLIALMVGGLAAYIAQPWNPDGWSWWKAALFIGLSFFGMWGTMSVRYWAYKGIQEREKFDNGSTD